MNKILYTILLSSEGEHGTGADKKRLRELASRRFEGFSIFEGQGSWNGEAEPTFQVLIATEDHSAIQSFAEDLKQAFRQDSVVEIRHAAADVIFH